MRTAAHKVPPTVMTTHAPRADSHPCDACVTNSTGLFGPQEVRPLNEDNASHPRTATTTRVTSTGLRGPGPSRRPPGSSEPSSCSASKRRPRRRGSGEPSDRDSDRAREETGPVHGVQRGDRAELRALHEDLARGGISTSGSLLRAGRRYPPFLHAWFEARPKVERLDHAREVEARLRPSGARSARSPGGRPAGRIGIEHQASAPSFGSTPSHRDEGRRPCRRRACFWYAPVPCSFGFWRRVS
jgi:hypothetical protein